MKFLSWWKPKVQQIPIPPYAPPIKQEHAPKEDGIEVEEIRDPSESAIIRFVHKVRGEK